MLVRAFLVPNVLLCGWVYITHIDITLIDNAEINTLYKYIMISFSDHCNVISIDRVTSKPKLAEINGI